MNLLTLYFKNPILNNSGWIRLLLRQNYKVKTFSILSSLNSVYAEYTVYPKLTEYHLLYRLYY